MSTSPYDLDCLPFLAGTKNTSVRIYRSLGRRILEALVRLEPTLATASDHDKIIVVDDRVGVVGGRNIEAKYFAHPDDLKEAFHDVDVVLEGSGIGETLTEVFETIYESERATALSSGGSEACAAALRLAYESMNAWLHDRPLDVAAARAIDGQGVSWANELQRFPHTKGVARKGASQRIEAETRILDSVPRPGSAADAVSRTLSRLFEAASHDILMESPYLVLTEPAAAMLASAGERDVEMTLLTNSPRSTDNALSQLYFREQWPRLLAGVPELRLFVSGTTHNVHSKLVVFDDQVVLLGSYNLDPFSMLVSGEVMVAIWSQEVAKRIGGGTRATIARGAPEVYQYTIERNADGDPVRTATGNVVIKFGPGQHTEASEAPLRGFRWALLRAVPWLAGLPPFF
jgi:phosphatidylserine/phosphatidylglycerophosphate/cardiolipin synthase-like enzyme